MSLLSCLPLFRRQEESLLLDIYMTPIGAQVYSDDAPALDDSRKRSRKDAHFFSFLLSLINEKNDDDDGACAVLLPLLHWTEGGKRYPSFQ